MYIEITTSCVQCNILYVKAIKLRELDTYEMYYALNAKTH